MSTIANPDHVTKAHAAMAALVALVEDTSVPDAMRIAATEAGMCLLGAVLADLPTSLIMRATIALICGDLDSRVMPDK